MGIPHRVNDDDWYEGMLIPKNSTVILPIWGMHMSEETGYKDPEEYNPDRFLDWPRLADAYAGSSNYCRRDHYSYGAGRRVCPGIHLAERTQWRLTSRILWAFQIQPEKDSQGKDIPIDVHAYHHGISHTPKEFPVRFNLRSQEHLRTLKKELAQAREFLAEWND
jgi:cytochrome P450